MGLGAAQVLEVLLEGGADAVVDDLAAHGSLLQAGDGLRRARLRS
jgi:hypothetical protein